MESRSASSCQCNLRELVPQGKRLVDKAQPPSRPTASQAMCRRCNRNANISNDPRGQVTRPRSTAASQQMANQSGTSRTEASTPGALVRKPPNPQETRGVRAKATINTHRWPRSAASGSTTGVSKRTQRTTGRKPGSRQAALSPPRWTLDETDESGLAFYAGQLSQTIVQEQAAMQDAWAQLSSKQRRSLSPPRNDFYGLPPREITSDEEGAMAGRKQ